MTTGDPLARNNVHVLGNAGAPGTLVFVHGFGTDQRAWREVAAAFADRHRIVLLDNAGAGGAAPDAFVQHRYLGLEQYALDLAEVCDALRLRAVTVVGHSIGAMIGVLLANRRPELVARLVLLAATPHYLNDGDYRGGLERRDVDDIYSAVTRNYTEWACNFAPLMVGPAAPELARDFAATLTDIPADRAFTVLCSILQSDHRAAMAAIRQPTLIVQTRDDALVPLSIAEWLRRTIPDARLEVIDAFGHVPHLTAPAAVIAALRPFVDAALS